LFFIQKKGQGNNLLHHQNEIVLAIKG